MRVNYYGSTKVSSSYSLFNLNALMIESTAQTIHIYWQLWHWPKVCQFIMSEDRYVFFWTLTRSSFCHSNSMWALSCAHMHSIYQFVFCTVLYDCCAHVFWTIPKNILTLADCRSIFNKLSVANMLFVHVFLHFSPNNGCFYTCHSYISWFIYPIYIYIYIYERALLRVLRAESIVWVNLVRIFTNFRWISLPNAFKIVCLYNEDTRKRY